MTVMVPTSLKQPELASSTQRRTAPRVLVAESSGFSLRAVDLLSRVAEVQLEDLDRPALLERVGDVEVLWVRLRHAIDAEVLERARALRIIVTPTTGLNHICLEAATHRGIRVLSLRGEVDFLKEIRATAELTIGLMLTLLRHIPAALAHASAGGWNRDLFRGRELCGKTIGIVGYGRLGRIVARLVQAFGASVCVADPNIAPDAVEPEIRWLPLEQLLQESDLISIHVSLSRETAGMIGREQFAQMREGAWLINTSRGELIDEAALLEAMRDQRLAGAALDVLCREDARGMSHRVIEEWRGVEVETLEDLLRPGLRAVCVGINPAPVSVAAGHYYQGRLGQAFSAGSGAPAF